MARVCCLPFSPSPLFPVTFYIIKLMASRPGSVFCFVFPSIDLFFSLLLFSIYISALPLGSSPLVCAFVCATPESQSFCTTRRASELEGLALPPKHHITFTTFAFLFELSCKNPLCVSGC